MSGADPLPPLRDVIARHDLQAKKALGQNFIFDLNLTRRIAREAGALGGGNIYEVGPGPGGLTRALLAEGADRVVAVERDPRCLAALSEIDAAWPGKLDVVSADALEVDEATLLQEHGLALPVPVAANLPYNIGTQLLVKWLTLAEWPPWWASLTLMFQKEVAERICAEPGDDGYGRLSVLAHWRSEPKILFEVPRQVFVPPPKITSVVIRVTPLPGPRFPCALKDLEAVTQAAFGQRRKMLRKSLKQLRPDPSGLLHSAGIAGEARPEDLTLEQFCALARAYAASR